MEFHEWLRTTRESKDLMIKDLAAKADVTSGGISQIENQRTQPLFQTVVKLVNALGISPVEALNQMGLDIPERIANKNSPVTSELLTLADLMKWILLNSQNKKDFRNPILDTLMGFLDDFFDRPIESSGAKIYFHSIQSFWDKPSYSEKVMEYPLFRLYSRGELIFLFDLGYFIRTIRLKEDDRLIDLEEGIGIQDSLLQRIEQGEVRRIKFNVMVDIYNSYLQDSEFFLLACWDAFETYNQIEHYIKKIGIDRLESQKEMWEQIDMLVRLYRYSVKHGLGAIVLEELRKDIEQQS